MITIWQYWPPPGVYIRETCLLAKKLELVFLHEEWFQKKWNGTDLVVVPSPSLIYKQLQLISTIFLPSTLFSGTLKSASRAGNGCQWWSTYMTNVRLWVLSEVTLHKIVLINKSYFHSFCDHKYSQMKRRKSLFWILETTFHYVQAYS